MSIIKGIRPNEMTRFMAQPKQPLAPPPVGATVHIYRGLMDRATSWRIRIDAPTNWAIITSGTAVSFVLGNAAHSHAVILLVMLLTFGLMVMETRRMRYYDLWGSWLRLLETEYYAPILRKNHVTAHETWQQTVINDMGYPHFKTTFGQLLGRRLRDNYLAIYCFLIMCWLIKLLIHPRPDVPMGPDTFVSHAAVGPFPGWIVLAIVLGFYTSLFLIMFVTYSVPKPSIEVLSRERTLQKLASPMQQPMSQRQRLKAIIAPSVDDRSGDIDPLD